MKIDRISKYITIQEGIKSRTAMLKGINNTPDSKQLLAMQNLGFKFFDELREFYDTPIYITSFFRSLELNTAIGGASKSDHQSGEAIDIDQDGRSDVTNNDIFNFIQAHMDFYKLIGEFPDADGNYQWIHVSYKLDPEKNKERIVMEAYKDSRGKTKYRSL